MKHIAAAILASLVTASALEAGDPTLLRLFLADGTAVASYGEYARVGDRVVFSMPLGADDALQLINLPAALVDWDRTLEYADAARAEHYAATRGESEYALVTSRVASLLNDIARTDDPQKRLDLARRARHDLEAWPGEHYGYRAEEVGKILVILDDIITELRAAAGETRFALNLVTGTVPVHAPPIVLQPPPGLQNSIDQAIAVARLSDVPADRMSLLSAVALVLDRRETTLPSAWVRARRREVTDALDRESRFEREYGKLTRQTMQNAETAAARADVRKFESLREDVRRRDAKLGYQRPAAVQALLAALDTRLDAARRLRLARDRWELRQPAYDAYQQAIEDPVQEFDRQEPRLEDIRRLAGPQPSALTRLAARLDAAARRLVSIRPPEELRAAHELLVSASRLAVNAVDVRAEAVRSGDVQVAWDASAAAAGAMMLFSRAREDMDAVFRLPQLR